MSQLFLKQVSPLNATSGSLASYDGVKVCWSNQQTLGLLLPNGTTAQRSNTNGFIRYNTDSNAVEIYQNNDWLSFAPTVTAGTYNNVTVDQYGRVTSGTTSSSSLSFTGDVTGSGSNSINLILADSGVTAGTYNNVMVDSKGRITNGSNVSYLTSNQSITVTGDVSGSGTTSLNLMLANIGTSGTYTKVTTDTNGRVVNGSTLSAFDIPYLDASKITTGILNSSLLPNIPWASITSTPVTLVDYGITDAQPLNSNLTSLSTPSIGLLGYNGTSIDSVSIQGTTNQVTVTNGNGASSNPTVGLASNPVVPGNNSITIPSGTTIQRPASPTHGMMRFNTDTGYYEVYQGTSWLTIWTGTSTPAFTGLSDAPTSYSGQAGNAIVVNGSSTGLSFASIPTTSLKKFSFTAVYTSSSPTQAGLSNIPSGWTINYTATGTVLTITHNIGAYPVLVMASVQAVSAGTTYYQKIIANGGQSGCYSYYDPSNLNVCYLGNITNTNIGMVSGGTAIFDMYFIH